MSASVASGENICQGAPGRQENTRFFYSGNASFELHRGVLVPADSYRVIIIIAFHQSTPIRRSLEEEEQAVPLTRSSAKVTFRRTPTLPSKRCPGRFHAANFLSLSGPALITRSTHAYKHALQRNQLHWLGAAWAAALIRCSAQSDEKKNIYIYFSRQSSASKERKIGLVL